MQRFGPLIAAEYVKRVLQSSVGTSFARCFTSQFTSLQPAAAQPAARAAPFRPLAKAGVLGLSAVAAWTAASEERRRAAQQLGLPILRLYRDVVTAASILADYKWSLRGLEGVQLEEATAAAHQRSADKLLGLIFANGGLYIKFGQHVGQLDHLLPAEYVETMRAHVLDKCPVSSFPSVCRIIEADLGAPPSKLFASFEETPIASASLAQVHVATLHSGEKVAVKVQHEGLLETSRADIATVGALTKLVHWAYPDFDYQWLVVEANTNVPQELDFTNEAANAERCQQHLESSQFHARGRIAIPAVHHHLTSKRVLVMEYFDGVNAADRAGIEAMGIQPKEVAELLSTLFNELIFVFGFVHCDPHAGNILVRRHRGRAQLVLLDHGLYRSIPDDMRHEYAALWQALIFGDAEGIKRHSQSMQAADAYPLFAAMLTSRSWEQVSSRDANKLRIPATAEERARLVAGSRQYTRQISDLLRRMPSTLRLLLKTNDCLRSIDFSLGQPINTLYSLARESQRALNEQRLMQRPGLLSHLAVWASSTRLELQLLLFRVTAWLQHMQQTVH